MRVMSPAAICVAFVLSVHPTNIAFAAELRLDPSERLRPPLFDFSKPAMTEFDKKCMLPTPESEGLACVHFDNISPGTQFVSDPLDKDKRDILIEEAFIGQPPMSAVVL